MTPYVQGEMTEMADRNTFIEEIQHLRDYFLSQADVVVSACSNAAVASLYDNFKADVVYIDEAEKALNLDMVIAIAHYELKALFLVGDDKQLRPTVFKSSYQGKGQNTKYIRGH